ncbi:4-(cytidine 5'-diphospho)-2-C-methyl-D-erythritol kinase [uncultured Helicobacter sp.]|uniref:4-(cytidine 5'-diphospho)-2-C-methyl-D-erythritol kinase n=1 Tax=uncultured Helicobacter sp. TaxID=175537 RepID=UPI0026215917|nr:4-(cytidine 5'-diphospho)-2-C-methyl-D-erythritol kinase [uncultured Helicobacter sp.]
MNLIIYPKLNIFLKIIGYKEGFHQLNSRFVQAIGEVYDEMQISSSSRFMLMGDFGCEMQDNLIYKAKCAMEDFLSARGKETKGLQSLKIEVQKVIPKGAGLGGGSGNAGAFLRGVNAFLELGLSDVELIHIAQEVGADVSFFASGVKSANVSGRGECIEPFIESPLKYDIYTPPISCDTAKVYQSYKDSIKSQKCHYSKPTTQWFTLTSKDLLHLSHLREELNDLFLSATLLYPALKDIALDLGEGWYFSGSGSSFFRIRA